MNKAMTRLILTGAFALICLIGAVGLEFTNNGTPEWLIAMVAAASGYIFGHVQENGINGKKP